MDQNEREQFFNDVVDYFPTVVEKPYNEKENVFMDEKVVVTGVNPSVLSVERKASPRINPDAIPVLATAVGLVSLLMVTSFAVSFSGIYEVSAWTGLPPFLQWLPAVFIDAAILAYTISLIVFKARGESVWRTLLGLSGFATVSVIANISHTLSFWDGSLTDFRAWVGVLITASAPIAVLLASEEITRLAFESKED
jgi:hypothetical protein